MARTDWESITTEIVTDRRRGKRVNLRFPVEISGFDRAGNFFSENTFTTDVSKTGCRAELTEPVERGDTISIKLTARSGPGLDSSKPQKFKIVWRSRKDNVWTIGALQLTEDQVWHVAFPEKPPRKIV